MNWTTFATSLVGVEVKTIFTFLADLITGNKLEYTNFHALYTFFPINLDSVRFGDFCETWHVCSKGPVTSLQPHTAGPCCTNQRDGCHTSQSEDNSQSEDLYVNSVTLAKKAELCYNAIS